MSNEVSIIRIYLLRALFFLNFAMLGADVWPTIINHSSEWNSIQAVAFSLWATLSTLSLLGIRYPLKMLPLLLFQFTYKLIWLIIFAAPRFPEVQEDGLFWVMAIGLIFDIVVIPWLYVVHNFVKAKGNPWGRSA